MSENREMVFSACIAWFQDWVHADPPILVDEWDLTQWMDFEMHSATHTFLTYAFHTPRARNDAIMILRALYYEYFLFQQELAKQKILPNPRAVAELPTALQTPQKSHAWHVESRDVLSGHEFGGITVGSVSEYTAALAKKSGPVADVHGSECTVFLTPEDGLSPFKWGWRFEPVARDLYSACFADGAPIYDGLGRIRHATLPRLGASPDGLVMAGPRCGRLVELKCPISRELNGSIPMRYWVQMQLQAEVCDVDAVEYFEVSLGSVAMDSASHTELLGSKLPWIGKVCVVAASADAAPSTYEYAYSPLFEAKVSGIERCMAWVPDAVAGGSIVLESAVWWVKDYHTQTVLRNPRWWNTVGRPAYEKFWEDVEAARADGRFLSRPLFIDDSEAEEEEVAASDHESADIEDAKDDRAISSDEETASNGAEGWQGVESDHDTD